MMAGVSIIKSLGQVIFASMSDRKMGKDPIFSLKIESIRMPPLICQESGEIGERMREEENDRGINRLVSSP